MCVCVCYSDYKYISYNIYFFIKLMYLPKKKIIKLVCHIEKLEFNVKL